MEDINKLVLNIQICQDCDGNDVKEWITSDSND